MRFLTGELEWNGADSAKSCAPQLCWGRMPAQRFSLVGFWRHELALIVLFKPCSYTSAANWHD